MAQPLVSGALTADAAKLAFGDPANLPPQRPDAIGYPSRDPKLDVLPGFVKPPHGYGEVPFYWWLGDRLTKERLAWQLDQLSNKGIVGLQINYAHTDAGGNIWGLTMPSDPPLFSDAWWDLVKWFAAEAKKRGMAISLSDYTLGIVGQGYWMDEILKDYPDMRGSVLEHAVRDIDGGNELSWDLPETFIAVTAFRVENDKIVPGSAIDLRSQVQGRSLRWKAAAGTWRVAAVHSRVVNTSVSPLDPRTGTEIIKRFFQRFEDHLPGEGGKALNFFFSDELNFGIGGNLWHKRISDEFKKRKGYDLVPELPAVFMDIGPRTPKVRMDYKDVMVALEEEAYFKPVFDWHYQRGMLYGGDHGGRGYDVTEFGDYYRTQRWMLGPGNDQPFFGHAVVKTKVHSSISHMYNRPRTWLEGYHSSGWGSTPAQLVTASQENYALGSNLQVLHGLYYSLHGGFWEWAPPCNHFRMPYWAHMGTWMKWSERLCYLLSQGDHRCDVAVIYPVTPSLAGMEGNSSVQTAFGLAELLFTRGIDFDFVDEESVVRATVQDKELRVSGERFRVLMLPSMKALNHATLSKAVAFKRAGGLVFAVGDLPEASDRIGRNDPEVAAMVKELFGGAEKRAVRSGDELVQSLAALAFPFDYKGPGRVLHRVVGNRDIYLVCGAPENAECSFRAQGKVELWDPWTGTTRELPVVRQSEKGTTLRMPLSEHEAQLIVFSPGKPLIRTDQPEPRATSMDVTGEWDFELVPTMDNRWGDFRWPATPAVIGAEARQFRYADETTPNPVWQDPTFNDEEWKKTTYDFGPKFWKLGPLPENADIANIEKQLAAMSHVDPAQPVKIDGKDYLWKPYDFSWRWGVEGDPGHEGYHGLKENVTDDFIALGRCNFSATSSSYEREQGGTRYFLWTSVVSPKEQPARLALGGMKPAAIWLNKEQVLTNAGVGVKQGSNPLLLRFDQPGRAHVIIETGAIIDQPANKDLSMTWNNKPGVLPFDTRPEVAKPAGWYRFIAPPGLRAMTIPAKGTVQVWADGVPLDVKKSKDGLWHATVAKPAQGCVKVAIRIEQVRGAYAGAAMPEPITLECGPGRIAAGDWAKIDGLACYSGGAWYRKSISLSAEQIAGEVTLDLGNVAATAEVRINGSRAGIRVAAPWTFDISRLVKAGENRVEVLVYNTLANHYRTIPTRYRGSDVSGLLGPVRIETGEQPGE